MIKIFRGDNSGLVTILTDNIDESFLKKLEKEKGLDKGYKRHAPIINGENNDKVKKWSVIYEKL